MLRHFKSNFPGNKKVKAEILYVVHICFLELFYPKMLSHKGYLLKKHF